MAEGDGRGQGAVAQAALLDDPAFLRGLVHDALQAILDAEMTAHLGAERYERTEGRSGHRNEDNPRTLRTRVGRLELRAPQDREGVFSTELFARYQRTEQALVGSLARWRRSPRNCVVRACPGARSRRWPGAWMPNWQRGGSGR